MILAFIPWSFHLNLVFQLYMSSMDVCSKKPHPFGNEFHSTCSVNGQLIYQIEPVEGKNKSIKKSEPKFYDKKLPTTGVLLRFCKKKIIWSWDDGCCIRFWILWAQSKKALFCFKTKYVLQLITSINCHGFMLLIRSTMLTVITICPRSSHQIFIVKICLHCEHF